MEQVNDIAKKKNFKVLKWVLVVGIVIVLNLFFNYAVQVVYKEPQFDNFCKQEAVNVLPVSKEMCLKVGGQWNESSNIEKTLPDPAEQVKTNSYCDVQFTCRQNYETARDLYSRNVFIVLISLGIISIILSFVLSEVIVVSLGLSLGGILSLIIASMRYWSAMDDYLRVVILGLALALLIWLGIKKFKE